MIDSEQVPWGKGEKQAGEAVEIEPETIRLQGTEALPLLLSVRANPKSEYRNPKQYLKFEILIFQTYGFEFRI